MTTTRRTRMRRLAALAAGLTLALPVAATAGTAGTAGTAEPTPADRVAAGPAGVAGPAGFAGFARATQPQVLAISVDGLNVRILRRLGPAALPHLFRLLREGASTRNARTQVELTLTLPNHTSMLTGRRIDAAEGGHGVTWNRDRSRATVHRAAGEWVASIFSQVHDAGLSTALFATESKFSLFERTWPHAIDRSTIVQDGDHDVTLAVRRDLLRHDRALTFLHLGAPDEAGHEHGWLSPAYRRAVRRVDHHLGILLATISDHPRRLRDLVIVLTADHGGTPGTRLHTDQTCLCNYRVPFLVWGPGVTPGDLYELNPTYADPGRARVLFEGVQPIRNGDLANLVASLLGLAAVPGSLWNADQSLTWASAD